MTPYIKQTRDQSGFTLVEVMVAVAIFSLLMTMLTTAMVKGMQLSRSMGVRLDNINQGQTGMNAVTKALRTAVLPDQLVDSICVGCSDTALILATPISVTFYANLNNTGLGPSLMSYYIESDATNTFYNLVQSTQAPTVLSAGQYSFCAPSPSCPVTKRVITRGLRGPADPVFGYYDFDGNPMVANPMSADDRALVSSIDITLKVQTNPIQTSAPTNTIVQRVTLPNATINVLVQP